MRGTRRWRRVFSVGIIFFIVCIAVLAVGQILRDTMIIYLGIQAYRGTMTVVGIGAGLSVILAASSGILAKREARSAIESEAQAQVREVEERRKEKLIANDRIEEGTVRRRLEENLGGKWGNLRRRGDQVLAQMDAMNRLQADLHALLTSNGAESLRDAENVLEQAEQKMFLHIRSLLNHMSIRDSAFEPDVRFVSERIEECLQRDQELIDKTREFNFALTDYLNRQGDSGGGVDMIDAYRRAIMESIQEFL